MNQFNKELLEICKSKRIPYGATFELTPLCNFDCNMCYVHLSSKQIENRGSLLSSDDWIKIGKEAAQLGTWHLTLTGGEIFTRADFNKIYDELYRMGHLITLRTNGYLLSNNEIEWLKKRKPTLIMITLYGSNDNTYQKICGVKDGFSVVSRNIDRLLNEGFLVSVSMTQTIDNYLDEADLKKWCKTRNLNLKVFQGLTKPNEGVERNIEGLSVIPFIKEIPAQFLDKYDIKKTNSNNCAFSNCKGYGAFFTITWDGKMTLCTTLLSVWENPFFESLMESYDRLYRRLDQIKRPKECEACKISSFCSACPAKFFSESGNPEIKDDELCRIARYNFLRSNNMHNIELIFDDECF